MQGYLFVKAIDSSACIRAAPQVSITAWRKMTPWHGNTALIAGPLWWNPPVTCDSPCVRGQQSGALICWLVEQAVGHTVVICYAILSSAHVASLQWYLGTGDPCMDSNNRDMSDSLVLQIYTPNLTDLHIRFPVSVHISWQEVDTSISTKIWYTLFRMYKLEESLSHDIANFGCYEIPWPL